MAQFWRSYGVLFLTKLIRPDVSSMLRIMGYDPLVSKKEASHVFHKFVGFMKLEFRVTGHVEYFMLILQILIVVISAGAHLVHFIAKVLTMFT